MSGQKTTSISSLIIWLTILLLGHLTWLASLIIIEELVNFIMIDSKLAYLINIALVTLEVSLLFLIKRRRTHTKNKQRIPKTTIEQAAMVLNSIGEGVLAIEQDGNISFANPEAQRLLGWDETELLGVNWQTVIKLVNTQDLPIETDHNPIQQAITSQTSQTSRSFLLKAMSGKSLPINLLANPLDNNSQSVIITFRDISLEIEEEREQREFISTASHEMRTPVAAIEGYLGLVLNPKICNIDAKASEYIGKAQEASKHLGELFRNLLSISKAEDGRMHTKNEAIELVDFVAKICDDFLDSANKKGLQLKFLPKDQSSSPRINPSIYVQADRGLLREALSNLLENAIKYTNHGSVKVDVNSSAPDKALVQISDTGIGIPGEDISHLFQKFYRVDNSQTREINGTGLGLYLTRRIIENLHGQIWVESQLGQGSHFFVSLTRIDDQQARQLMSVAAQQVLPSESLAGSPTKRQSYQVPPNYQANSTSSYTFQTNAPQVSNYQTAQSRQPVVNTIPADGLTQPTNKKA